MQFRDLTNAAEAKRAKANLPYYQERDEHLFKLAREGGLMKPTSAEIRVWGGKRLFFAPHDDSRGMTFVLQAPEDRRARQGRANAGGTMMVRLDKVEFLPGQQGVRVGGTVEALPGRRLEVHEVGPGSLPPKITRYGGSSWERVSVERTWDFDQAQWRTGTAGPAGARVYLTYLSIPKMTFETVVPLQPSDRPSEYMEPLADGSTAIRLNLGKILAPAPHPYGRTAGGTGEKGVFLNLDVHPVKGSAVVRSLQLGGMAAGEESTFSVNINGAEIRPR